MESACMLVLGSFLTKKSAKMGQVPKRYHINNYRTIIKDNEA